PARLIKMVRPDILVKGGDYHPDQVVGSEYAGKVEIIEFEEGYSTTGLVNQIAGLVREGKL
ncbi:MAG: bifunctional heptose 7-phosphate kinase/heptose 1-phosphate adenyltransferase, partial [Acidaminococcaceae bacterium]|nr:bifunctional heptose 7-phosphate kinase/heptose 1-phosphate adenyltransferase [Acidaminococcaceae bacterium]